MQFVLVCRDNVLFGKPLQQERYSAVLEACALQQDVDNMANADETAIGDRGVTLSGGQRARLSLARAMYQVHTICCAVLLRGANLAYIARVVCQSGYGLSWQ